MDASGAAWRARPTARTLVGSPSKPPLAWSACDGRRLANAGGDATPKIGRLGIQLPIEVAAQLPRDRPRLELEDRRRGAREAKEAADGGGALPGHDAARTPDPHGRRQTELGQLVGKPLGLSEWQHELEMRPSAGQAERATGQESAAQPGQSAVLGGRRPREGGLRSFGVLEAHREPGHDRVARTAGRRRPEALALGDPTAGTAGIDGRQLRAQRLDELSSGVVDTPRRGSPVGSAVGSPRDGERHRRSLVCGRQRRAA